MDKSVLIIFGAGSEKALGFPITKDIEKIFMHLLGVEDNKIDKNIELSVRLNKALKKYIGEYSKDLEASYHIYKNLELTLRILIDGNGAKTIKDAARDRQEVIDEFISLYKNFLETNFKITQREKFEENIYKIKYYLNLQPFIYDWINMRALTYYLYKDQPKKFNLVDLLNILYISKQSGISLVVPEYFNLKQETSYDQWYKCNIDGVLNVYKLILYKIYKGICYINFSKEKYKTLLTYYYKFIKKFIDKYKDKVTFASFNWNPIIESLSYRACYIFNNEETEHYRYIDHSALINMATIDKEDDGRPKERPSFTQNTKYFLKK
ncbi:MAG TPA: hypothetical protein ENO34_03965 [Sulfurihydrogenibium azorense]|uniref:SIR2-like domain-containing protein n=1 Tax=Sulfurihydrogenibium azorense TaxID=309806 RepID=A0A831YBD7_9AQUI|nr:hypothetical protein [Sulfurihydrogenibium azorense]